MKELYFPISSLFMSLSCLVLGLFVFIKNRSNPVHRTFFLLNLGISQWSFFYFLMLIAKDHQFALWAARWLHLGAVMIPVFFVHFVVSFLGIQSRRKAILAAEYAIGIAISLLLATPLIVEDVKSKLFFDFWPVPGILYPAYLTFFFAATIHGHVEMILKYRRVPESQKVQIRYILMAFLIGFSCGSTTYPLFYDIPIPPIGTPFVVLTPFIIAYAILRHRLLGIDLFLKYTLVVLIFSFLVVYPSYFVVRSLLETSLSKNIISLVVVLFCLILTFALTNMKMRAELTIDQLLFKGRVNLRKVLDRLAANLSTKLNFADIGNAVVDAMENELDFKYVSLVILDAEQAPAYVYHSKDLTPVAGWDLALKEKVIPEARQLNRTYLRKEILMSAAAESEQRLKQALDSFQIKICLPLTGRSGFLGALLCGKQGVEQKYAEKEAEIFDQLRLQLGISVENAIAYETIADLNKGLSEKVEERTRELQKSLADLQEAQTQIIRSGKLAGIGSLAAGIAHEINNALNGTLNCAYSLDRDLQAVFQKNVRFEDVADDLAESLQVIRSGMNRTRKIVESLMRFSRKNSEGYKMDNIHEGIESTLMLLQNEFRLRNIELACQFGETAQAYCNLSELNQVFFNIIKNALDAVEQNGKITIKTWTADSAYYVSVEDTGPGIDEKHLDQIFDPFFTTKPVGKGTGLGLSTSYTIVRDHGGQIEVKSRPGHGSIFTIQIPLKNLLGKAV